MVADTLYWDIKTAAGAALVALALEGIGDRVYGQLIPGPVSGYQFSTQQVRDVVYPCLLLTSEGETEESLAGDSEGIAGRFPQRVWIADQTDPGMHARERIYLTARKTILRAFHQGKLANRPEVRSVLARPDVIFDPRLPQYQYVVSGLVLLFEWGQPRYP